MRRQPFVSPMLAAFLVTAALLAPPKGMDRAAGLVHAAAVAPGVHLTTHA